MNIDYSSPSKVILLMINYIGNMIDYIPEEMKGKSSTPASHHLFEISEDATKLSHSDAELLHHFVAQLLYLSKGDCPEIQIVVYLLCTRVRGHDTDDYKNIARVTK